VWCKKSDVKRFDVKNVWGSKVVWSIREWSLHPLRDDKLACDQLQLDVVVALPEKKRLPAKLSGSM